MTRSTTLPANEGSRLRELMAENRALRASLEAARERKAAHRLASYQARHDPVTGLPNRALFDERLEAAIAEAPRSGRGLALMFLDLDGFKAVNDSLGHDLGDRLLKAVAGRMQGCIRLSDTLARYGGDEFALLLPGVRARQDAAAIAGKILGCLGKPFQLAGRRLGVGVSIGIALYPEAGDVGEDLIRRADVAMYHVKGKEKNAFLFFSEEMDSEEMDPDRSGHLVTDRELHAGLIRGELELRYRPRVNLATGRITTLEAGWRWRHPERGLIGPGDTVAPERPGGAMAAVDSFLHRQAFEQTAEWRRRGTPDLGVAVALPAGRLAQPGFIDGFMENLRAADLDAAAATVEIDEAALMEPVQAIAAELADLRRRGVRVAASGFGAGFSSLRYLERLALHGLNLAPALMRDVRPGAGSGERTIAAIAAAAAALGLELFASGVETRDQLALLKSCGFSEAGGSVFSGAVPGSDIGRLLTGNPFASVVGV